MRIVNTLVAENTAPSTAGGGLYTNAAEIEIVNSTFASNSAGTYGGGIYILSTSGCAIANSIFWGNTASVGNAQIADNSNPVTVDNSDVQDGWGGSGANNIDDPPLFVDTANDNYRLGCSSPCIDFGSNGLIADDDADVDLDGTFAEQVPWDLDSRARLVNTTVDMGAYENTVNITCPANISVVTGSETSVDINDLLAVIGSWGACPPGPTACPGDIWSANGCGSDGVVDINDLLAVIGAWGECGEAPDAFPGGLNDCFNVYCAGLSGAEWQECLEKCFAAFCEARPEECD